MGGSLDFGRLHGRWLQEQKQVRGRFAITVSQILSRCHTEVVPPAAVLGFLRWRLVIVDKQRICYKGELEVVVEMLQQSTLTCKELRTQLLVVRSSAARSRVLL